jgi:ribonucleoside-diphosphate reductase alpha chain
LPAAWATTGPACARWARHIKGTNGESQGVVPFLKVVNDTAVAVNQGGKRKGAVCTYLETWHLDIEEFLELRKNTGDDRRRTHDMNTANWIPDLFMRRVMEKGPWTLFSPSNVPDLHDLFGADFEKAYVAYEEKAARGEIKPAKTVQATDLWRKMLSMLFETGHPWITFKDACNVRSPQQHAGVVHSSNLCTEITLNTSDTETAVCNLGSVNLLQHLKMARLTTTSSSDHQHRDAHAGQRDRHQLLRRQEGARLQPAPPPGGPGLMGFQDALYELRIPYASQEAVEFADRSMEADLLPRLLGVDRAGPRARPLLQLQGLAVGQGHPAAGHAGPAGPGARRLCGGGPLATLDWDALRNKIAADGMRNSNCVAIAPTATISNIIGVDASIEPCFGNLSVKSNLSGEFTVINSYLVRDLKRLGLWDDVMVMDLKHFDGSLRPIDRVPQDIKALYATAFEVETPVAGGSRRAPPEVDRPGPEPEHLHGRRLGQEAGRHLQARLAARPEDHLLPAHQQRHARREIHRAKRPAERRVLRQQRAAGQCHERTGCRGRRCARAAQRIARHRHQVLRRGRPTCEACQ